MNKQKHEEQDFETVKIQFIAEWEDGKSPTLPDYIKRFPQFADELIPFVLGFAAMEEAAKRVTESPQASDATNETLEKVKVQMRIPVENEIATAKNLTEARETMGWSFSQLVQQLNLPKELVLKMVRGYEEWSPRLEQKIAALFNLNHSQTVTLLRGTEPIPSRQYKATGQPTPQPAKSRSFQADLEEFDRHGKLTPAQRQEWMEEKE